jgi:putative phosphoribosyl transferase
VKSRFRDRVDAGRQLAALVAGADLGGNGTVVLGLPRGGVPVAAEVARALGAPLDVIVVRKLGVPAQPELALGAIGEGGVRVENDRVMGSSAVHALDLDSIVRQERAELVRRARRYRGETPRLDLDGRGAVIVDDGIATGSTAYAACLVARAYGASRIVLAVPVAPRSALPPLGEVCDDLLSVANPESFYAVGEWYDDFSPTTDEEVVRLLRGGAQP